MEMINNISHTCLSPRATQHISIPGSEAPPLESQQDPAGPGCVILNKCHQVITQV